ncbi:MAG: hypothetical protein WA057_04630 [Candidatus Magasanikiibacteriota bacterium]
MTPMRKETNLGNNQPVRLYKFIALTFLLITIALFCVIVFMSSKEAAITITTKTDPIDTNKYVVVGPGGDWQGFVTTTLVLGEKDFNPTGNREEPAIATGVVTLVNESNENQPLIATTRLLTPEGILFRLKDRVLVPAKSTVEASVYADQLGAGGNIGPVEKFIIPGLREDTQKVIYAKSVAPMSGGVKVIGVLSDADVKKAEEVMLNMLEEKGKEALAKLNINSSTGVVYKVVENKIENNATIGTEVAGFNLKGTATVLAVFYNNTDVQTEAMSLLNKRIVDGAENLSEENNHSVVLDSYDLVKGTAVLQVFANGKVKLDPSSKQLDKMVFYGKTKDEIRRYLLSLDHVQSVDISFKPAWMRTVPHVADHVQVIVKEVE